VIPARPGARGDTLLFRRIHHRPFKEIGDSQAHGARVKIVALSDFRIGALRQITTELEDRESQKTFSR